MAYIDLRFYIESTEEDIEEDYIHHAISGVERIAAYGITEPQLESLAESVAGMDSYQVYMNGYVVSAIDSEGLVEFNDV